MTIHIKSFQKHIKIHCENYNSRRYPNTLKNLPKRPSKPSKNLPESLPEPSKIDFQLKKSIPQSVTWPSWLLTLPQLHCNVILNPNFCDLPPKIIPKWIKNQSKIHVSCLLSCNFIHTTRKLIFALPSW